MSILRYNFYNMFAILSFRIYFSSEWGESKLGIFEALNSYGDSHYRDTAQQPRKHKHEKRLPAQKYQPNGIGYRVLHVIELYLFAKGSEGYLGKLKQLNTQRYTHYGETQNDSADSPQERRNKSSKNKPDNVSYLSHKSSFLICLGLAINTTEYSVLNVGKSEYVRKLLLGACDATGIFAEYNVLYLARERYSFLFNQVSVLYNINGNTGINVSEYLHIENDFSVYLDNILLTHFIAMHVLDNSYGAIELIKSEKVIKLHASACGDMVDNNSVFYRIYMHYSTSRALSIRLIRIILP